MALRSAISFGALLALTQGVAGQEVTTQNAELQELFESGCQTNLCETAMLCLPCNPYPTNVPDYKDPSKTTPNTCSVENFLEGNMVVNGRAVLSGFCSEPLTIGAAKQELNGVSYLANCKGYVQPGWRNQVNNKNAPNHPAEDYVVECREGEVTCNDGTCEKWKTSNSVIEQCFQKGFTDDVSRPDSACNFANPDTETSIWDQYVADHAKFAPGAKNYCRKHGGVRKHPLKCSRAGGRFNGANNAGYCSDVTDGEARPQTCVGRHIKETSALVKSWVDYQCAYPCPNTDNKKSSPGCCIPESGISFCTTMELYTPVVPLTYDDCVDTKNRQRNCGECDDADYGLCCYKNPKTVTCTNQAGITKEGEMSKCAEAVYGQSAGDKKNVCTATKPGVIEEPRQFIEGLELEFKMTKADEMDKKSDCCCSVTCSCYGDPHCTSFYGDYEFTDSNSPITYPLVDDDQEKFSVMAKNGPPGGVITDIWVSYNEQPGNPASPQKDLHINADACADRTGGYEDLANKGYTDYYAAPIPKGGNQDLFKQINFPTVYVHASNYHVQIFCKTQKAGVSRIDIIIKKDSLSLGIEVREECCPQKEQVKEKLAHGKGFCFRENNHNYLDYFKGLGARRLAEEPEQNRRVLADAFQIISTPQFASMDLPVKSVEPAALDDIIAQAAALQNVPRQSVAADIVDGDENTIADLKAMTTYNDDTCERFAKTSIFPVDVDANKCVEGLYLQAKKKGITSEWKNVLFFPEGANYCSDGKMYLWFKDIVFDAETGETLASDMDIQFKTCTVDPAEEGCAKRWACQETMSVDNVRVASYLIGSAYADAIATRQTQAWDQCACRHNDAQPFQNCFLDCFTTGNCPGPCPVLP